MDCVDCPLSDRAVHAACLCGCCAAAVCQDHLAQELTSGPDGPDPDVLTGSGLMCELCAQIITWQGSSDHELASP